MPLYEFHCRKCGKDSEILTRSSDWQGTKCPACGSTQLMKKLSVFSASVSPTGGMPGPACSGHPSSCGCCGGGSACGLS